MRKHEHNCPDGIGAQCQCIELLQAKVARLKVSEKEMVKEFYEQNTKLSEEVHALREKLERVEKRMSGA